MIIGYKLLDAEGNVVRTYGGEDGVAFAIPNPLVLPGEVTVCGASADEIYNGYKLVAWESDIPATPEVTPRQTRMLLLSLGMTPEQADAFLASAAQL